MKMLGVDPSLNSCGWAILDSNSSGNIDFKYIASGTIKSNGTFFEKLKKIIQSFELIIAEYCPSVVSVEETFINNNSKSSLTLGIVRGAIFTIMLQNDVKILEFSPNTIKKTITGNGKADKQQVAFMLQTLIPKASPKTHDESDAIAIAITGILYNTRKS